MTALPDYDPQVIEQFARNLYRKASAFVVGSVAIGASLGSAFGAVPLTSLGDAWPVPSIFGFATLLIGGIAGAVVGYVIGDTRSFGYRLQAQTALCQLQTERNTAILAQAVAARAAAPAARPQPAARPAAPAPSAQPQHAAPPPVAPQPPAAPPVQREPAPAPPAVSPPAAPALPADPPVSPPISARVA